MSAVDITSLVPGVVRGREAGITKIREIAGGHAPAKVAELFLVCKARQSSPNLAVRDLSLREGDRGLIASSRIQSGLVVSFASKEYGFTAAECFAETPYNRGSGMAWCRYPFVLDFPRQRWAEADVQGIFAERIQITYKQSKTHQLAVNLLKQLHVAQDRGELGEIISKEDASRIVAAAGLLVQLGAARVAGNLLTPTEQGLKLLDMISWTEKVDNQKVNSRAAFKTKLIFSGVFAFLGAAALASKAALKHAARAVSLPETTRGQITSRLPREAVSDANYLAYARDAAKLEKEFGKCIVAYADGQLIAVGKDIDELENKIPSEYWKRRFLIKDIPEKIPRIRPRIRVTA